MQRIPIAYRATGRFTRLVCDHLDADGFLQEHSRFRPTLEGIRQAAAERTFDPGVRTTLVSVIRRQYAGQELQGAVAASIEALLRSDSLTVTTGHQLCLFTGPLYVPFKLLNTVRLARTLAAELGRPVVPVFWMATEDHDRAEIDHAWLGSHKVQWRGDAGGPVGRMTLEGIGAALDEVDGLLGQGADADALRALLRESYRPGHTLAEATRRFVDGLFGRFGLVVLDGDDPVLKRVFAPIMREELLNRVTLRAVTYANERLAARYDVQAHAREINLFHLRPGHRSRIVEEDGRYRVLDGGPVWTMEEILAELEERPQDFSPNVLLRPVYQERILPNIAYIGGGGELAYWMQLRWSFQALQVPMPAVVLRTSAAFLPVKLLELWRKEGLTEADLFAGNASLSRKVALERASFDAGIEAEKGTLNAFYDALLQRAIAADPTLKGAVEASRIRALRGLDQIGDRFVRAAKRQQRTTLDRVGRVQEALFPDGGLQERRASILPLLAARGNGLLDELLDRLDPLDPHFSLLVE